LRLDASRRLVRSACAFGAWVALVPAHVFSSVPREDWKSLYNQGVAAIESGDFGSAVVFFERANALQPSNPQVLLGLASVDFRSGKAQQGLATVHQLLSLPGVDFNALMSAGHLLMNSGRLEEAIDTFKRAQKIAPPTVEGQNSSAYFDNLFAYLLAQSQQNQQAVERLQSLVKAEPNNSEARFRLVLMLVKTADFGRAYETAQQALQKFPDDPQSVLSYALACYFTQRTNEAESAYLGLIRMEPNSDQPYFALGNFYSDLRKFDDAAKEFEIAVSKDPKNYLNHYMYGTMLFRLNKISEASDQFKTALELNPSHADSYFWLGRILVRQGNLDEALATFERTVKLEPKHIAAYYQLGLLYARKGEKEKSEQMFQIQNQLNADIHKGIIYERMP
jgi:tetratricopeptide (TPR) repeat protein